MGFDYNPALTDAVSRTRFLLADTDEADALLTDEGIATFHTLYGVDEGTAKLAGGLLAHYGNEPDTVNLEGAVRVSWANRVAAWQRVIDDLRAYGSLGGMRPALTIGVGALVRRDPYGTGDETEWGASR